jgi:hypothetical protein
MAAATNYALEAKIFDYLGFNLAADLATHFLSLSDQSHPSTPSFSSNDWTLLRSLVLTRQFGTFTPSMLEL